MPHPKDPAMNWDQRAYLDPVHELGPANAGAESFLPGDHAVRFAGQLPEYLFDRAAPGGHCQP